MTALIYTATEWDSRRDHKRHRWPTRPFRDASLALVLDTEGFRVVKSTLDSPRPGDVLSPMAACRVLGELHETAA